MTEENKQTQTTIGLEDDDLLLHSLDSMDAVWVATDHNGGLYYIAGDYDVDYEEDDLFWDCGHFHTWYKHLSIGEPHQYPDPQSYFAALTYKTYINHWEALFAIIASKCTPYSIVANMSLKDNGIPLSDKVSYGESNYYLCGPYKYDNGTVRNTILGGFSTNDAARLKGTDLSEISYAIRDFTMDGLLPLLDRSPDVFYQLVYFKEGDDTHVYELSTEPFDTPRSGCIGVFNITKSEAIKQLGIKADDWKSVIRKTFKSLLTQYNAMITGNVSTFYHSPVQGSVDPNIKKDDLFRNIGYDIDYGYSGEFMYALDSYAATLGLEVLCTAAEYAEQQPKE